MSQQRKILILGSTGMLGRQMVSFLANDPAFVVTGTHNSSTGTIGLDFDARKFTQTGGKSDDIFQKKSFDVIINCIGIIKPFCRDNDPAGVQNALWINSMFPHVLSENVAGKSRIIQIATDCVYSGRTGGSTETTPHDPTDVYGKSKSLGEVFDKSVLNIRCSIIGHESEGRRRSLLEWFLSHSDGEKVNGYTHHRWNGVTTLQFAQLCSEIIKNNHFGDLLKVSHVHHFIPNETVTKAELLEIMNQVYNRRITIQRTDQHGGESVDRTLDTNFSILSGFYPKASMWEAIADLKNYWFKN
jgi:dTDP-4-dehydrorhamnose reductase